MAHLINSECPKTANYCVVLLYSVPQMNTAIATEMVVPILSPFTSSRTA